MKTFFAVVTEKSTVIMSVKVAFFVGSILSLINYGDRILLHHDMLTLDWIKIAVTYCVPYCVATYGAAKFATKHSVDKKGDTSFS